MPQANSTRRDFLKTGATAAGGIMAATMGLESCVHAAGNDLFRIGLIGCGGRGTGAAAQALKADPNARLVAMCDVFSDRLEKSLATLKQDTQVALKVDVKPEHRFLGFDQNFSQPTGNRGRQFSINLIGNDFGKRLVSLDPVTFFFQPASHGSFCNRFS